jgi:ferritin-like metal-binding protein YciE
MALKTVLIDELRDMYSAENQLVKALPKLAKGSKNPKLKSIFTAHLAETKGQVERLKGYSLSWARSRPASTATEWKA